MKIFLFKYTLLVTILFNLNTLLKADTNFFLEGEKLFKEKKFDKAKFKFEKDIVFNPKNESSYLFLAKIFSKKEKKLLEETNLKTVLLLNPKNEEALYRLALLEIKKSNFSKSKELINTFENVCKKLCPNLQSLKNKLEESLKT
jgi:tetratricopeptide (TPR) repeat protein